MSEEQIVELMASITREELHRPVPRGTTQTTDGLAADIARSIAAALCKAGLSIAPILPPERVARLEADYREATRLLDEQESKR